MGRFSRVKGGHGSKKSEAPDLEAHFPDGAWYDIVLRAADPSRNRFLVQARDFPDEEEWVEADKVRPQSQPFEDLPKEGSVVLALHRSARSDLFFEGIVTDSGPSSYCKVKFTEGRAKGQTVKCELDDVNRISTKRCSPEELRRWCPRKEAPAPKKEGEVVSFDLGDFVLIEGPDDSCWVAQLLEPYTGKLSEEVDDVDDDGPRISLRWLYTPDELPSNVLKGTTVDNEHEVFLSFHKDTIDARLIKGKCSCVFGTRRPRTNFKWMKDTMFSCRTWDPAKKKISAMDDPLLSTEFRNEIDRLISGFPFPESCCEKEKDRDSRCGGSQGRASTEGAVTGNVREGCRRQSDEPSHAAAAAVNDSMESDGKRGRKGRLSTDTVADRRGSHGKSEEPVVNEIEAVGSERRKSSRGSGVGESANVAESVSIEVDAGPRRCSKGGMQGDADEAREDMREAKPDKKGRSSKGHDAHKGQDVSQMESKADAKRELKEVKEDHKKSKRKSENGEVKMEKISSGDSTALQADKDVERDEQRKQGEGKEGHKTEQEEKKKEETEEKKEEKEVEEKKEEKEEERPEKRGKKGKKDKHADKERESISANATDNDKLSVAGDKSCAGNGTGKPSKESVKAEDAKAAEQNEKTDKSDTCADKAKGLHEDDSQTTVKDIDNVDADTTQSKNKEKKVEVREEDKAKEKERGKEKERDTKDKEGKEKDGKEKEVKEKKRTNRGSSELAALQADVSNSDMLSSIVDTGKRRCTPATYFTYDDTGNQADLSKANLKSTHHRSPDKLDGHRVKTRELAGLGVEPTRAGRRAVLDALEDPPRRERQVPDRYDAVAPPKAKKTKQSASQSKTGVASRRSVNGKDVEGDRDDGDLETSPAHGAAHHGERRGRDDNATASTQADIQEGSNSGQCGRGKGSKKGTPQKEQDDGMGVEEDVSEARGSAARSTRKRGNKHDDDKSECELDPEGASCSARKKGKANKKDATPESAAEEPSMPMADSVESAAVDENEGVHEGDTAPDAIVQDSVCKESEPDAVEKPPAQEEVDIDEVIDTAEGKKKADEDDDMEEEEEEYGIGIVELRDDDLTAEPLWQFEERTGTEEDAIKGFVLETLRQACADFLPQREYKGLAYFLHPAGETQRAVSLVDVAQGFSRKGAHKQCADFLKGVASEKQATAMMLVVEDSEVHYPRMGSQVAKSVRAAAEAPESDASSEPAHRGLLIQFESEVQRRVWHIICLQTPIGANGEKEATKIDGGLSKDDKVGKEAEAKDSKPNGQDAREDKGKDAHEADKESAKCEFARCLCLRELDIDRCNIMPPIISSQSSSALL